MISRLMEITTKIGCSLNCRFCPQQVLISNYFGRWHDGMDLSSKPTEYMTYEVFQTCLNKIPKDVDIHFSGMCEAWLNPRCTDMVVYACQNEYFVHVYTTLVGMKWSDYIRIRDLNLKTVVLHIPDVDGNSKFPESDNYRDMLTDVIQDAIDGKFRIDRFSCHGTVHPAISKIVEKSGIPVISKIYDRAGNVKETCDVKSKYKPEGSLICKWCGKTELDKNVLLPDRTVLLCCMDYGLQYPLGNLKYENFEEISEGKIKQAYRKRMESLDYGEILCRKCFRSEIITEN